MSARAQTAGTGHSWCFRCGAELPATGGETLWCPGCGAPQLTLPDEVRVVSAEAAAVAARTTGNVPPPRPQGADWRAIVQSGAIIGALAALLNGFGLLLAPLDALGSLLLLLCGLLGTTLYRRMRPALPMNARVGARVGLVSGLLTLAMVSAVLSAGAMLGRFALGRGPEMDDALNRSAARASQAWANFAQGMNTQGQGASFPTEPPPILSTPAGRAGSLLLNFAIESAVVLSLATASGALAGSLARRRTRMGRAL